MLNPPFQHIHDFNAYGFEHLTILVTFIIAGILFIKRTKNFSKHKQRFYLLALCAILTILQLLKIPVNILLATFDKTTDLPFHLCNFLPLILFVAFYLEKRIIWATSFFWIILGTSQSNFTPTVTESLFHYDAIRYWLNHTILVILALYPLFRWKWKIFHKDVWSSFLWLNIIAALIYFINSQLGSNYLYIMEKPPGTTFFTILPEWPIYILYLEVILIIWSYMLYGIYLLILTFSLPQQRHNIQ